MEWILHAMNELSMIFRPECSRRLKPLLTRVRYGIKEELTDLATFRGIGRSRARTLYNAGIRGRRDVAEADVNMMAALPKIGVSLAKSLKEQAGHFTDRGTGPYENVKNGTDNGNNDGNDMTDRESKENDNGTPDVKQSNLLDF